MKSYIAIPHQMPAYRLYDTGEDLGDHDTYVAGDHDLHAIVKIETEADCADALRWKGHQEFAVHGIAREIARNNGWTSLLSVGDDEN